MSIESRSRQFGKVFDHWQIKEFLGSGSGGKTAVFRLQRMDSSWGVCALKIVNLIEARGRMEELTEAQLADYQAAREECSRNAEREVRLMDELRGNTNIVDYLDHTFVDWSEKGCFGRDLLIRMELLTDLRSELRRGKCFSEAEIIKLGRDICTALVRCHSKNILHRDVKPENIFRNKDGDYKLGDFGVSRVLDACPGAVASTGIGTYEYWPAEQMTGSYDKRVDIYSLGLVLYELSNRNRLPFAATTYVTGKEVSLRLSGAPMTEPAEVSQALARVILKACAFKREDRYQSAEDFLRALDWLRRKNHAPIASPEVLEQDVPAVHFETVPARPEVAPNTVFETQPAQSWEPSFETQPARSRKNIGGSYLKEQNHRKKRKNKRFFVSLTALLLCAAVGVFTGQRIWKVNKYSAAKKLLEERKFEEAITAFEALGDYQDSPEQMERAQLAADYEAAKTLSEAGKNEEAVTAFAILGGYRDSAEQMERAQLAADYEAAKTLLEVGKNEEAVAAFAALGDYRDSLEQMENAQLAIDYAAAESLAQSGKTAEAAMAFYKLGDKERSFELWDKIAVRDTISGGMYFTVGLKSDGTVVSAGAGKPGQSNVNEWTEIVAVCADYSQTVGLKNNGTVVAVGQNDYGQCNVSGWTDIVAVATGEFVTLGLKADGTVAAVGKDDYGQCKVSRWADIVAVSAGSGHTIGLKSDGTVVAVGRNDYGQCDVSGWADIVAVSAGSGHTIGLKSDGTVVAVGDNGDGQCAVNDWTSIVDISSGGKHTIGLRSDGTVVAAGSNLSLQCDVGRWKDIVAITTGFGHTVGLTSDRMIVLAGATYEHALDIQKWPQITLPHSIKDVEAHRDS